MSQETGSGGASDLQVSKASVRNSKTSRRSFMMSVGLASMATLTKPGLSEWLCPETAATSAGLARIPRILASNVAPHVKGPTPFAVILCQFNDLPWLSIPTSVFSDLVSFGKGGVFDYYADISYGTINLSGSGVFGPYQMQYSFFKDGLDPLNNGTRARYAWVAEAKRLAGINGVPLSKYYGVIAVVNGNVDDSNDNGRNLALGILGDWGQTNWQWCSKCKGLAYAGNGSGACVEGGHDFSSSGGYRLVMDKPIYSGQTNWRWCNKCQALAFAGDKPGVCFKDHKPHDHTGSANYSLALGTPHFPSQNNWKWCRKCQALIYGGTSPGPCPAGGVHDLSASGNYNLIFPQFFYTSHLNDAFTAHEMGHCFGLQHAHCAGAPPPGSGPDYCDPWDVMGAGTRVYSNASVPFQPIPPGLNGGNLARLGWIPDSLIYTAQEPRTSSETIQLRALSEQAAKGYLLAKIVTADRIFTVEYRQRTRWDRGLASDSVVIHELRSPYTIGQNNWKYCGKCYGLVYAGFGSGTCPAGTTHDTSASGDYSLISGPSSFPGQNNWKWCSKCQGLVFAGLGAGPCPAGLNHDLSRSFNYTLLAYSTNLTGQDGWKWCRKCQGLAYAANGAGRCSAGGSHDHTGSADYMLPNFGADEPFLLDALQAGQRWVDFKRGTNVLVDRIDPTSFAATITV